MIFGILSPPQTIANADCAKLLAFRQLVLK